MSPSSTPICPPISSSSPQPPTSASQILLLAPLSLGKALKTALEQRSILDKGEKITKVILGPDGPNTSNLGEEDKANSAGGAGAATERKADAGTTSSPGIQESNAEGGRGRWSGEERRVQLRVPTTITVDSTTFPSQTQTQDLQSIKEILLNKIRMRDHADEITLVLQRLPLSATTTADRQDPPSSQNLPRLTAPSSSLLGRVIEKWLLSLPPTGANSAPGLPSLPSSRFCSYTIYPPMLLLSARTWLFVADRLAGDTDGGGGGVGECRGKRGMMMVRESKELMEDLYKRICKAFNVTHIALSGPIPATVLEEHQTEQGGSDSSASSIISSSILPDTNSEKGEKEPPPSPPSTSKPRKKTPNVLRSPFNSFTPLHNDFGPSLPAHHVPTPDDFAKAFWCTVRQNGIFQTWAPRYTMFSRGNLSEKTRLLKLLDTLSGRQRTIKDSIEESGLVGSVGRGEKNEEEKEPREGERMKKEMISAVDLYAGVGYFAFCYAAKREVVGRVFCWEISRWSVEGLRRGAVDNGWGVKVFEGEHDDDDGNGTVEEGTEEERLIVYRESNEHATARIAAMRTRMPPVRHVNCGFLPSSKESWETAVQVLDPIQGGWIHAHENIEVRTFERRRKQIEQDFRDLVERHHHKGKEADEDEQQQWQVECVHFEQVKTYAPGIVHCVLDISISRLPHPPTDTAPQTNVSTPSVQK
ncbi:hypothetical protein MMC29_004901 [Sticta canariensis]|nr:hypothetical protein [Sticta canariensis]